MDITKVNHSGVQGMLANIIMFKISLKMLIAKKVSKSQMVWIL